MAAPEMQIITPGRWVPDCLAPALAEIKSYKPTSLLGQTVRECFEYLPPELALELFARARRDLVVESALFARIRPVIGNGPLGPIYGPWEDHGLQCRKMVDTTGVNWIVGIFTTANSPGLMKFHGIGTSSSAPAITDTALFGELTTQYQTANTRATGTFTTGASNNIYQSSGTNQVNTGVTIQEHGIFTAATSGTGTLIDRSLVGPWTLVNGDQTQTVFNLTLAAGG